MDMKKEGVKKISLFGNFGTLNIGNECTLQAIAHNIQRYWPGSDVNCICSVPEDVRARHGLPAFPISERITRSLQPCPPAGPRSQTLRILRGLVLRFPGEIRDLVRIGRVLRGRDMLLMTGTGMLADAHEGPFGLPYEIFKWILVAKIMRVRVLFVSVGVQPLRYRLGRWLVTSSLALADYVGFRDRQSREYMAELGFRKASVVFPDLAFSLPERPSPIPNKPRAPRPVIGVGLFDYRGRGANSESDRLAYIAYLEKLTSFVAWLVSEGYPVRVLIGDIAYDTPVREDLQKSLRARGIGGPGHRVFDEPIVSIADLFGQIGSTDIVVASRFHNLIIALLQSKPVIGISYDRKIDALMAETGLPEFCLNIADFSESDLRTMLLEVERRYKEIPPMIRCRIRAYRAKLDEQYRLIFSSR